VRKLITVSITFTCLLTRFILMFIGILFCELCSLELTFINIFTDTALFDDSQEND